MNVNSNKKFYLTVFVCTLGRLWLLLELFKIKRPIRLFYFQYTINITNVRYD